LAARVSGHQARIQQIFIKQSRIKQSFIKHSFIKQTLPEERRFRSGWPWIE
jgi:hypothetical protein